MPELSRFFGVVITMFYNDHEPAHFHARYGTHKAIIGLDTLNVLAGSLPPRVMGLVLEWVVMHRDDSRLTGVVPKLRNRYFPSPLWSSQS